MDRHKQHKDISELKFIIQSHINDEASDIKRINDVIFGDPNAGELGMVHKVNEMYDMLIQAKGVKSLLGIVMLIGAALGAMAVIKTFFIRL